MNWAKKATKLDNVYRANRLKILANDGITAIGMRLVKTIKKLVVLQNK